MHYSVVPLKGLICKEIFGTAPVYDGESNLKDCKDLQQVISNGHTYFFRNSSEGPVELITGIWLETRRQQDRLLGKPPSYEDVKTIYHYEDNQLKVVIFKSAQERAQAILASLSDKPSLSKPAVVKVVENPNEPAVVKVVEKPSKPTAVKVVDKPSKPAAVKLGEKPNKPAHVKVEERVPKGSPVQDFRSRKRKVEELFAEKPMPKRQLSEVALSISELLNDKKVDKKEIKPSFALVQTLFNDGDYDASVDLYLKMMSENLGGIFPFDKNSQIYCLLVPYDPEADGKTTLEGTKKAYEDFPFSLYAKSHYASTLFYDAMSLGKDKAR